MRRLYGKNVPPEQTFRQGRMAADNAINKSVNQQRSIQPGTTFWRQLRTGSKGIPPT